jgi:DNA primase
VAGSILREDIEAVRERIRIEDVVGERVALKSGGVGSLKGLCPFHDEKTPSFHVRPAVGRWHCFGCGEGGDVISFLMKADGLAFADAVEYLAGRAGITLRYETGGRRGGDEGGGAGARRSLLEANRVAAEFYVGALVSPEAKPGRDFLLERNFDKDAAARFGVGYAPKGWHVLTEHMRTKGFTEAEIEASGLASRGQSASGQASRLHDRFRGRLVWPIRAVTGEVIGFGARKLLDDDDGPKYLNTPETALYKKSLVLYGLDLAKRDIAAKRQVVVVEGYTDVMACHLAGVTTAVATCGTAFGEEHARMLRRLLGGNSSGDGGGAPLKVGVSRGEVIFTFDADDAGQNAALKAFTLEAEFLSQTFVAVAPDGLDPCDLRLKRGDAAVVALIEERVPLFEFVIKAALAGNDLETPEGRVAALRAAAPVVAGIRDAALGPEYARRLAGWLGVEYDRVKAAVIAAAKTRGSSSVSVRPDNAGPGAATPPGGDAREVPNAASVNAASLKSKDPVVRAERLALEVLLQVPQAIDPDLLASLDGTAFTVPQYRAVWDGIAAAGGASGASGGTAWVGRVADESGEAVEHVVSELAVSPLPQDRPADLPRYARSVIAGVLDLALTRRIADARGRMQRIGEGGDGYQKAFADLVALEGERRALREE